MNSMSHSLARATIVARLAKAEEQRPARRIEQQRREERRRRRRSALGRWWHERACPAAAGNVTCVPITPADSPSAQLARVMEAAALHVTKCGTSSERTLLSAMSEVARRSAPGAAAALVDPDGTEIARLRAFGVVHTHLLEVLGPREHALVLELSTQDRDHEWPGRAA